MDCRHTEDGCMVWDNELVWEVMYRYINAEISEAEPECKPMIEIPPQYKIWKHKSNCRAYCRTLNNRLEPHLARHEGNGYHPTLPIEVLFSTD